MGLMIATIMLSVFAVVFALVLWHVRQRRIAEAKAEALGSLGHNLRCVSYLACVYELNQRSPDPLHTWLRAVERRVES